MKKFFKSSIVPILFIASLMFTACSSEPQQIATLTTAVTTTVPTTTPITTKEPVITKAQKLGEAKDGLYTNSHFGIEMSYPKDWTVSTPSERTAFLAENPKSGSSIRIIIEQFIYNPGLDVDKHIEFLRRDVSQAQQVKTYVGETFETKINDKVYKCFYKEVDIGNTRTQELYHIGETKDYIICLISKQIYSPFPEPIDDKDYDLLLTSQVSLKIN